MTRRVAIHHDAVSNGLPKCSIKSIGWAGACPIPDMCNGPKADEVKHRQNESGDLDRVEFHRALELMGVVLSLEESDRLFRHFDADSSGAVDYKALTPRRTVQINLRRLGLVEIVARGVTFSQAKTR